MQIYIYCSILSAGYRLGHVAIIHLSRRLLPLSGGGEADSPDAVRAVHRVPGAPFSSAAQQQR